MFSQAFLYSTIFLSLLCLTSSALINQGGHFWFLSNLQEVKTPFLIVVSFSLLIIDLPKILGSFSEFPNTDFSK